MSPNPFLRFHFRLFIRPLLRLWRVLAPIFKVVLSNVTGDHAQGLYHVAFRGINRNVPVSFTRLTRRPTCNFVRRVVFVHRRPFNRHRHVNGVQATSGHPDASSQGPLFPGVVTNDRFVRSKAIPIRRVFTSGVPTKRVRRVPVVTTTNVLRVRAVRLFPFDFQYLLVLGAMSRGRRNTGANLVPKAVRRTLRFVRERHFIDFHCATDLQGSGPWGTITFTVLPQSNLRGSTRVNHLFK